MLVEVADETDEEASVAALDTAELASLSTDCASALTEPASRAAAEIAAVVWKRMMNRREPSSNLSSQKDKNNSSATLDNCFPSSMDVRCQRRGSQT